MRYRVFLYLSALAALDACDSGPQGPQRLFDPCESVSLILAPDLDQAQRDSVAAGAELWRQAAGANLSLSGNGEPLLVAFEEAAPMFFGVYEPASGRIVINETLAGERARTITVAHEIGHAFGLAHVSDRESIMNPGNRAIGITADDLVELRSLWGACALHREEPPAAEALHGF